MKKIVLVIPTLELGGAERVISILANVWSRKDFEVHLVMLTNKRIFYKIEDKVNLHRLGFNNSTIFNRYISEIQTFINLRKLLKNLKPDFVLSFMIKYNIFVLFSNCGLKNKIFVSDRDNPYVKEKLFFSILHKWTYKLANGIIVQTDEAKAYLTTIYKNKKIVSIPNPIKQIKFNARSKKEKIILNIGRLVEKKGQKYLIESFAKINDSDWKLVFIGDGPLKEELHNLVKINNIETKVEFLGAIKDIDPWLNRASIFAFTSIYEGFPNALAEAMAAGLACISFDCPTGPKELIKSGYNGYLIPLYDITRFTSKLDKLIKNEELREKFGSNAQHIRTDLDSQKIASQYLEFCI